MQRERDISSGCGSKSRIWGVPRKLVTSIGQVTKIDPLHPYFLFVFFFNLADGYRIVPFLEQK